VRNPTRILSEMMRAGDLGLKETPLPRNMKRITPIAKRQPDVSVFSEEEIGLVNDIVHGFSGWSAGRLSKYTHELPHWHTVPLNETIPYELIFVAQHQGLTKAETKHGLELAHRHGWPLTKSGR
jgi:hypothetical protein